MMVKLFLVALCAYLCVSVAALSDIIRPCKYTDSRCIQDNFKSNSRCNPRVRGSAPPVHFVRQARFEAPFFNSSYVDNNLVIRGLDKCVVSEYYINSKTDGGVIALDCPQLNFESERETYQHWSLREDAVYNYKIKATYPLIRLTTTLKKTNPLDLCKEFTFADVTALPIFAIDPKDKATKRYLNRDLSKLNVYERETFLYRGAMLTRAYINSVICDFGCK